MVSDDMMFDIYPIHKDTIIYKTEHSFIFTSDQPLVKYHLLISPNKIKRRLKDLDKKEMLDLGKCVMASVKVLKKICGKYTIALQDGKSAGQTVFHLHFHVIPISKGKIEMERKKLTHEEMVELANELRPLFNEILNE